MKIKAYFILFSLLTGLLHSQTYRTMNGGVLFKKAHNCKVYLLKGTDTLKTYDATGTGSKYRGFSFEIPKIDKGFSLYLKKVSPTETGDVLLVGRGEFNKRTYKYEDKQLGKFTESKDGYKCDILPTYLKYLIDIYGADKIYEAEDVLLIGKDGKQIDKFGKGDAGYGCILWPPYFQYLTKGITATAIGIYGEVRFPTAGISTIYLLKPILSKYDTIGKTTTTEGTYRKFEFPKAKQVEGLKLFIKAEHQKSETKTSDKTNKQEAYTGKDYTKYIKMGDAKAKLKDYAGAILDYNKAIELNPKWISSYIYRARYKEELKDYNGAVADYTKVFELDTKEEYYYLYSFRAAAKELSNDHKGALEDYNKYIKNYSDGGSISGQTATYNARGNVKMKLGDFDGACKDWQIALKFGEDNKNIREKINKNCNGNLSIPSDVTNKSNNTQPVLNDKAIKDTIKKVLKDEKSWISLSNKKEKVSLLISNIDTIKAKEPKDILARVLYGANKDIPAANNKVYLTGTKGDTLRVTETNEYGDFEFRKVNTENAHIIVEMSGKLKNEKQIYLAKQNGTIISTMEKTDNGFINEVLLDIVFKQKAELQKQEAKIEKQEGILLSQLSLIQTQRLLLYSFVFVIILILCLVFFIYFGYREKKKANVIIPIP